MGSQQSSRIVSLKCSFQRLYLFIDFFFQYSDLLVSIKLLIIPLSINQSVLKK